MIKKLIAISAFSISCMFSAQKISIMPSVGYAWRTAKMPSGLNYQEKQYLKGLKKGVNFDISAYYNLNTQVGLGVKYSNYSASSDGRLSMADNNGQIFTATVSTKDKITFFGPALMFSNFSEPTRHKLFYDIGLGVLTYKTATGNIEAKGSTLGLEADFGYQYQIAKQFLIGPKLGFTAGTLSKMTYNGMTYDFPDDEKEGLTRVSLSAVATFRF
jgi:hypothetical protein